MNARSISGNSPEEINVALQEVLEAGFKPNLAILFISIKQHRHSVCEILHARGIDILGATSSGEYIHGHQSEGSIFMIAIPTTT